MHVHVVVEYRVLVAVVVKEPLRVGDTEILKVKEAMWVVFPYKLHEPMSSTSGDDTLARAINSLVDELVICLPTYTAVWPALTKYKQDRHSLNHKTLTT